MKTVWKFKIDKYNTIPNIVNMPKGAKVIHVDSLSHDIFLWAEVDTEMEKEPREFWIFSTGVEIPDIQELYPYKTCKEKSLITDEWFVYHVYEKVKG